MTAPFAGIGNLLRMREVTAGATLIHLGSGAGMDCLPAGRQIGQQGGVTGFDMTDAMLDKARAGALESGQPRVHFEKADIARLPLPDASADVAPISSPTRTEARSRGSASCDFATINAACRS